MKRTLRKAAAVSLAFAMMLGATATVTNADAAKKAPKLSSSKLTLSAGTLDGLTVKKNKVSKIVKTKWTTSNKKVVKLSGKKATTVTLEAGEVTIPSTAKITAKVTYKIGKKSYTKTLKCTVTVEPTDTPVAGGWSTSTDPTISAEVLAKIEEYHSKSPYPIKLKPLACLATQVVEGMNYRVLGVFSSDVLNLVPSYAIIEFNVKPDGTVSLLNTESILKSDDPVFETNEGGVGVWTACDGSSVALTKADMEVFNAAYKNLNIDGVSYKPVAKIATEEAVLTNYCFICEKAPVVPNAVPSYCFVYVTGDNSDTGTWGADVNGTEKSVTEFKEFSIKNLVSPS